MSLGSPENSAIQKLSIIIIIIILEGFWAGKFSFKDGSHQVF